MFVGCPFGLRDMPSHFQRVVMHVSRDIKATIPYFDNIPFGSHNGMNMLFMSTLLFKHVISIFFALNLLVLKLVNHNLVAWVTHI